MIPFGPFAPDIAEYNVDMTLRAENVLSGPNGYLPMRDWAEMTDQQAGSANVQPFQCFTFYDTVNTVHVTVTRQSGSDVPAIYKGTNIDIAQAALTWVPTNYSGGGMSGFYFSLPTVEWDDDLLFFGRLATPQKTDKTNLATTTDIGGSPPAARVAARVRQQLVLGYTYEGSAFYPNRVRWSAFGDYEGWTNGTNQAGQEDLPDAGWITEIIGGEYGLVFQEHAITRMNYIGVPDIWEFDVVEDQHGCMAPKLAVAVGPDVYYLSASGFRVLRDGQRSEPIGANQVDRYLFDEIEGAFTDLRAMTQRWSAAYDPASDSVWWCVTGATTTTFKYFIYNLKTQRWTIRERGNVTYHEHLISPPVRRADSGGEWLNHNVLMMRYDGSNLQLHDASGSTLAAVIETGYIFDEVFKTFVEEVRLVGDGSWTLKLLTKADDLEDAEVTGSAISAETEGHFPCDSEARYHRLQFTSSGDWEEVAGFTAKQTPSGEF